MNVGEGKRGPSLARPETLHKLHTKVIDMPTKPDAPVGTPSTGSYGFGWVTITPPFAHEPFLFHGGSNEKNVAYIMLQPKRDFGIVMMTNVGGKKADQAMMALGEDLQAFLPCALNAPQPVAEIRGDGGGDSLCPADFFPLDIRSY